MIAPRQGRIERFRPRPFQLEAEPSRQMLGPEIWHDPFDSSGQRGPWVPKTGIADPREDRERNLPDRHEQGNPPPVLERVAIPEHPRDLERHGADLEIRRAAVERL